MIAAARNGLDKMLEGLNPDHVEEQRKINVETSAISAVYEKFQKSAETPHEYHFTAFDSIGLEWLTDVLPPELISQLWQVISSERDDLSPHFLNRLIQNSYDAGYNDFVVDVRETSPPQHIGRCLQGTATRKLELAVMGNLGFMNGSNMRYVNYCVDGKVGYSFGYHAQHSSLIVDEATNWFGEETTDCTLIARRDGGFLTASRAERATVIIHGEISSGTLIINGQNKATYCSCGEEAVYSTFKTSNAANLEKLMRVPENNKIIFIEENGTEKIIRDCAETP